MKYISISALKMNALAKKTSICRALLSEMMRKGSKHYDEHLASSKVWLSGKPGRGPVRYMEHIVDEWMLSKLATSQEFLRGSSESVLEITPPLPASITNVVPLESISTDKRTRRACVSAKTLGKKLGVAA